MLRIKNISEVIGKKVYTAEGDFFGQVEEVNLYDNKIDGWKIRVSPGFMNTLGGARGVVIPHQFVKAIGDVLVVTKASLPSKDGSGEMMDVGDGSSSGDGEELI